MNEPRASEQIEFLSNLQRLLSEGTFTATYKYALLLALADLSVIGGSGSGAMLLLDVRDIAVKFIEYYWPQGIPYISKNQAQSRILYQNSNPQKEAAILSILQEVRLFSKGSITQARANAGLWRSTVARVARLVEVMPLWKLQTIGDRESCFLYENCWSEGKRWMICLKPGVAYNFRRFHSLIESLIKDSWVRYIQRLKANQVILGQTGDLHEFLFGSERESVLKIASILSSIQKGCCFYCSGSIVGQGAIDHFVPWSRYPMNLGHNFVLAHSSCNSSKSDFLAATPHLKRWLLRNADNNEYLQRNFEEKGILHDLNASIRVAQWAYEQADLSHANVWLRSKEFAPLQLDWKLLFDSQSS